MNNCPLCAEHLDKVIFENHHARILFVVENGYPILRVVAKKHVKEMTDLDSNERAVLMQMVFACESVFRKILKADKINLASLGNVVPHVHWHIRGGKIAVYFKKRGRRFGFGKIAQRHG